jgi:DnaA family protein
MSHSVPQLPLALRYPAEQRFDTYVHAPLGLLPQLQRLADAQTQSQAQTQASLFLQGAAGSGKSHLLVATCAAAGALGHKPVFLGLKHLRGRVAAACEGLAIPELLVVDDVDAIAGQREDEIALFHLHNRVRDGGGGVLYAANAAPDALALALPDLRSRFAQCTRWELAPLDDAGRAQLLRQRASARGLEFDDLALDWLLRRANRDLGSLSVIFEQLDHASLAAQRRLTVPFLRQVLEPRQPQEA